MGRIVNRFVLADYCIQKHTNLPNQNSHEQGLCKISDVPSSKQQFASLCSYVWSAPPHGSGGTVMDYMSECLIWKEVQPPQVQGSRVTVRL